MALVVDNRTALSGQPGTHALIIGVSEYPFLTGGASPVADPWDMGQLSSTATTAQKITDWIKTAQLPVPLATCRLLLSPSAAEPALNGAADAATLDNVLSEADAWRTDASTDPGNVAFFYFAGHGIQRNKDDAVLCLHDFRRTPGPALMRAVDIATIRAGMSPAPARPNIARTQFYFVDACRVQPTQLAKFAPMETTAVFDKDLAGEDDRTSPVFYSSISNKAALAIPAGQTLFSQALLECLTGAGGDSLGEDPAGNPLWGVLVSSLNRALEMRIEALNRQLGADQTYTTGGQFKDATICRLLTAPMVDVQLSIDPAAACAVGKLDVFDDGNVVTLSQAAPLPQPIRQRLPAGLYNIVLSFNPPAPFVTKSKIQAAKAPNASWKVRVV